MAFRRPSGKEVRHDTLSTYDERLGLVRFRGLRASPHLWARGAAALECEGLPSLCSRGGLPPRSEGVVGVARQEAGASGFAEATSDKSSRNGKAEASFRGPKRLRREEGVKKD